MPALGVQSVASTLKAAGASLPGPGPDELTAVLGYLKPKDIEQIEQVYQVSRAARSWQYRQSGEPYITHPLAVAKILAEWHLDAQALMAALLHDVVEDTPTTKTEIAKRFGKAVAELVDGVSKIDRRDAVGRIKEAIQARLKDFKVEAQVTGREKHISSIHKKMQEKNISFSEVFDIYGFRIIGPDGPSCYLALGALHTLYKTIPGKIQG